MSEITDRLQYLEKTVYELGEQVKLLRQPTPSPAEDWPQYVSPPKVIDQPFAVQLKDEQPGEYDLKHNGTLVIDFGQGSVITLNMLPDGKVLEQAGLLHPPILHDSKESLLGVWGSRGNSERGVTKVVEAKGEQPTPKKVPPTLELLRSDHFKWKEWCNACFDWVGDATTPTDILASYMSGSEDGIFWQIKLLEFEDEEQDTRELCAIWDGHPDTMEHPTEGTIDIWAGSDGPGGGTGQVRYRVLDDRSVLCRY